jgi:hypothetical protein
LDSFTLGWDGDGGREHASSRLRCLRASVGPLTSDVTPLCASQSPPEIIGERVLQTFMDPGDRDGKSIFSSRHRDLLVAYVVVVFMHVCDFAAVPIKCVALDLGVSMPKVRDYCAYMGCKMSKSQDLDGSGAVAKAKLSVPLNFPERRKRAAAKKT